MMSFEEELRQALRRQEPSEDFTARVLERCAAEKAQPRRGFWNALSVFSIWRWTALAALLAVAVWAGKTFEQKRERQVRGEAAKQQLLLAMRIAGSKLQVARQRVMEIEYAEVQ